MILTLRRLVESPDDSKRVIVKQDLSIIERQQTAMRSNRLLTILKKSETDATLKDALEALEALYILKYNDDKND